MPEGEFVVDDSYLIPNTEEVTDESGDTSVIGYPSNGVVVTGDVDVSLDDGGGGSFGEPPGGSGGTGESPALP